MKSPEYKKLKRKWWLLGGIGAVFLGSGLCGAIESGFLKHQGADLSVWFLYGTLSIGVLIVGLDIILRAHRIRIKMDQMNDKL